MKIIEKLVNSLYFTILVLCIGLISAFMLYIHSSILDNFSNQTSVINNLKNNQKIQEKNQIELMQFIVDNYKKPTIQYLTKTTLFIISRSSGRNAVGTGVIIEEKDGYFYILTAKHVCPKEVESCEARSSLQKKLIKLDYVGELGEQDIILWKTNKLSNKHIKVNGISDIYPQEHIYTIGHYLGLPYQYSEGTVSSILNNNYIIVNLPCAFGCSGSGVFDKNGNVVGIISAISIVPLPNGLDQADTNKLYVITFKNVKSILERYVYN